MGKSCRLDRYLGLGSAPHPLFLLVFFKRRIDNGKEKYRQPDHLRTGSQSVSYAGIYDRVNKESRWSYFSGTDFPARCCLMYDACRVYPVLPQRVSHSDTRCGGSHHRDRRRCSADHAPGGNDPAAGLMQKRRSNYAVPEYDLWGDPHHLLPG